jgi:hypothetical protein
MRIGLHPAKVNRRSYSKQERNGDDTAKGKDKLYAEFCIFEHLDVLSFF